MDRFNFLFAARVQTQRAPSSVAQEDVQPGTVTDIHAPVAIAKVVPAPCTAVAANHNAGIQLGTLVADSAANDEGSQPNSEAPRTNADDGAPVVEDDARMRMSRRNLFFILALVAIPLIIVFGSSGKGRSSSGSRKKGGRSSSSSSSSSGRGGSGGSSGCFGAGTLVAVPANELEPPVSFKPIEQLEVGESVALGGQVLATLKLLPDREPLFRLRGIVVSGSHAVKPSPHQGFTRVGDLAAQVETSASSDDVVPLAIEEYRAKEGRAPEHAFIYNLITEAHRMLVTAPGHGRPSGDTGEELLVVADYMEVDDTPEMLHNALKVLNGEAANPHGNHRVLRGVERELRSCFPPGALVVMEDGTAKQVHLIQPGDRVRDGGLVSATMQLVGTSEPLYEMTPSGVIVSGSHTIRDPADGRWRHAEDAAGATPLVGRNEPVLYNLITENHVLRLVARHGEATGLSATDFLEIEEEAALLDHNLMMLNAQGGEEL